MLLQSPEPLCLSQQNQGLTAEENEELHQIMLKASRQDHHKIPLDWEETDCPEVWGDEEEEVEYNWYEEAGPVAKGNDQLYHAYIPLS